MPPTDDNNPRAGGVDASKFAIPESPDREPRTPFDLGAEAAAPSPAAPPAPAQEPTGEAVAAVQQALDDAPVAERTAEELADLPGVEVAITDIDHMDQPAAPSDAPPPPQPAPEIATHICGLPRVLLDRKELIDYITRHRVTKKHRDGIEFTDAERRLYELYTKTKRTRRVERPYFVAALRLWKGGFPLDPEQSLDLNRMKVGE